MAHTIDTKDFAIIRQVALKAAVELAKDFEVRGPDDLKGLAESLEDWLLDPFEVTEGHRSNSGRSGSWNRNSGQSSSRSGGNRQHSDGGGGDFNARYESSGAPCPQCVEAGRDGEVLTIKPGERGPKRKCSLESSTKRNGEWVETGACTWKAWE